MRRLYSIVQPREAHEPLHEALLRTMLNNSGLPSVLGGDEIEGALLLNRETAADLGKSVKIWACWTWGILAQNTLGRGVAQIAALLTSDWTDFYAQRTGVN